MYSDILKQIGLSQNGARIYEALLHLGQANASEISVVAKVHRRNIYDCMKSLLGNGLVIETMYKHETVYKPAPPQKLLQILEERERQTKDKVAELKKDFPAQKNVGSAYIYRGKEGYKNYMREILDSGENGYYLAAKGGWLDPYFKNYLEIFLEKSKKLGIKHYHLFDYDTRDEFPDIIETFKDHPIKFLPKGYRTHSAVDVFGDHVVTFTGLGMGSIEEDVTLYVTVDRTLAESYKTWFQWIWDTVDTLTP